MKYFDLHCDTLTQCLDSGESLWENQRQLSLKKGSNYTPWFQCFAVFIHDSLRGRTAVEYFEHACDKLEQEIKQDGERLIQCRCAEDLEQARRASRCGAVLTVEGGAVLAGDLSNVSKLSKHGVKALTLTWNGKNELGDGAGEKRPRGLTEFGKTVVAELENCRIAVDVSHASDPLFDDVASQANRPFLATHSNSRTVCNHKRNLTDTQFCEIVRRGGIVGVNFVPVFLNREPEKAGPADVVRHIEHFLSLGGEKTVAIGSDFDGTKLPEGISGVEFSWELGNRLLQLNYPEDLVNSIFFENAYQFFHSL